MSTRVTRSMTRKLEAAAAASKKEAAPDAPQNPTGAGTSIVPEKFSVKETKTSTHRKGAKKNAPSRSAGVKSAGRVKKAAKGAKAPSRKEPAPKKTRSESAAVKSAAHKKKAGKATKASICKKPVAKKAVAEPAAVKSTVRAKASVQDAQSSSRGAPVTTYTPSGSSSRGSSRKRSAPDEDAGEDAGSSQNPDHANSPKRQRTNHDVPIATKAPRGCSLPSNPRFLLYQVVFEDAAPPQNSGRADSPKVQKPVRKTLSIWSEDVLFQYPASISANADLQQFFTDPRHYCDFPHEMKQVLAKLLPKHVELPEAADAEPTYGVGSLIHNFDFRRCLRYLQDNLRYGRYDEAWLRDAAEAIEQRGRGELDEFEMEVFEDRWGYPLRRETFVQDHPETPRGSGLGEPAGVGSESSIHIPSGDNWSSLRLGSSDDELSGLESADFEDGDDE